MLFLVGCGPTISLSQNAMDAYNRGDYSTALKEWQPLAEQGDANAQYNLGKLYYHGWGVPQDYGQARDWYRKAAAQGYSAPLDDEATH
jgi:TPR repeat protein